MVRRSVLRTLYPVLSTQYGVRSAAKSYSYLATAIIFACLLLVTAATAAPPKLTSFFPTGCQRGQSASVTAAGEFSNWSVQIWADRPGVVATAEKDKGKLKIDVAADAAPGIYWLRLTDGEGASQLRPFIVGTLPEIAESETNDSPEKAQAVEPRVVVSGKLGKSGDVDGYRVDLKQGQTLVASIQGNSILGSPMDCVLQVCELVPRQTSSVGGSQPQVEAFVAAQNHDAIGLDPQIVFTAPKDGSYLVRIFAFPAEPDSSIRFAGGDNYIYRLTITEGGYVDHVLPLVAGKDTTSVLLFGWNLPAAAALSVPGLAPSADPLVPPDGPADWLFHADSAGAIQLPRTEQPSVVADEKSDPAAAQEISLPQTISGRFESPGDADVFAFQATKGQKLRIEVEARSLGFPTDAVISVLDEAGKSLAEQDDTGRNDHDPELTFTAPADGRYRAVIRDLAGRGDLRMVYCLSIEPVQPDFSLSLAADSFVLEGDKPLEIAVNVAARDGFRDPIEIHAIGLPAGVSAEVVKFAPTADSAGGGSGGGRRGRRGGNQESGAPSVKLILKGDLAAIQPGGAPFRIEGSTADDTPLVRSARFPLNLPLAGSHHAAWLTVKK